MPDLTNPSGLESPLPRPGSTLLPAHTRSGERERLILKDSEVHGQENGQQMLGKQVNTCWLRSYCPGSGGGRSWRRALGVGLVQEVNHAESLTREEAQLHARRLTGKQISAVESYRCRIVLTGSRRACVPAGGIPPNNHILIPGRWPRTLLSPQSPESGCL